MIGRIWCGHDVFFAGTSLQHGSLIAHRHIAGALSVFFATRNEPLQLLGWKALVVHAMLFAKTLDGRQLVLRVQNLEGLGQVGHLVMGP